MQVVIKVFLTNQVAVILFLSEVTISNGLDRSCTLFKGVTARVQSKLSQELSHSVG